jgi:curved DNA-binding protein CbpA
MGVADPETDLDPALRERIDGLLSRAAGLDHYALLGVARSADRKAIKSAYFALAATLHPDRHFGKRLGPWKQKMETLFVRLTTAHDTLASPTARPEYDAYLAERDRTSALERALDVDEDALEPAEERPVDPNAIRRTESSQTMRAQTPDDERARREALARKLAGGSHRRLAAVRPPSTPSQPAARPTPVPRPQVGVEALVASARAALAMGDLAVASHKMRLAAKIDARFVAEADALAKRVYASMADAYEKQARYEEAQEQWLAAALSWSKAFEGRSEEGRFAERAANALRKGGGDLHKAAQLAETAARLLPNDARVHATVAEIYLDAGLVRRARAAIDNASRLAPTDAQIRQLLKEIAARS